MLSFPHCFVKLNTGRQPADVAPAATAGVVCPAPAVANGWCRHPLFFSYLLGLFVVPLPYVAHGQVRTDGQLWLSYHGHYHLHKQWHLQGDVNYRRQGNLVDENFQQALRLGIGPSWGKGWQATVGYAWFRHFRPRTGADEVLPEHRGWAQVQKTNVWRRGQLSYRLRLENRHMLRAPDLQRPTDRVQSFGRLRLQAQVRQPLRPRQPGSSTQWFAQNEVMLHTGESIGTRYFDQNRLYTGLEWKLSPQLRLMAGYMHLIQYQPVQQRWRQSHVLRLMVRQVPNAKK